MLLPLANVIQDAFSPLISLFEAVLVFLHDNVLGGSWGLSIIGLTVVVRAALVPLTLSQFRSMQNMQRLAPEIKALQAKYKEDKQRMNEEMMKFYRENKVNPFASCIPLLLQLPVFISLFYMLRQNLKLDICGKQLRAHFGQLLHTTIIHNSQIPKAQLQNISCDSVAPHSAKFLFIPDITHKTTGAVLVVLLVLYVGSQLASSVMMSATADANQRRLMIALPFFFTIFIFTFPGGLLVYWITTNLWTIGQQYFVRRRVGPPPAPPAKGGPGGKGVPPPSGPGGGNGGSRATKEPALAGAAAAGGGASPPPPPRKKKKRSGRRR
jgi:YidC/Oxa1 family membrane protein insertase